MGNVYGYIRVSSKDQNIDRQVHKMLEKGVEERKLFIDEMSGKNFNRPHYQTLRRILNEGELVYIDALDRLGRNYDEVIKEWKYITREINADIVILENETLFDSRKFKEMGDIGKVMEDQFLSLLAYVAEQERKKIKRRQREGIEMARKKGKHLGRPPFTLDSLTEKQKETLKKYFEKWKNKKIKSVELMEMLNLKKSTFYKVMKQYEERLTQKQKTS